MKAQAFKFHIITLLIVITITSCTKVIDLKLGDNSGLLVIEGNITNMPGPQYIKISRNVAFTNNNTYPPVTGATVFISDGLGRKIQFIEGPAGTYSAGRLSGIPGITFTMTVLTDGQTYTASSSMPLPVKLDSLTEKVNTFNSKDNSREITVNFRDPANVPNQYRFVLYVNSVQIKNVFAFNDDFFNGRNVSLDLQQNDRNIYPGDTVTVEMQCIDKNIYNYWFTLMQQNDGAIGGVAPSNPPTNITPATLGYFSAHTTQSITFLVK
jgi:hypothetical protein